MLIYVPVFLPPTRGETVVDLVARYQEMYPDLSESDAFNVVGQQAGLVTSDVITDENSYTQEEFDKKLGEWAPGGLGEGYQDMITRIEEE